jgi:predicted DCC family thiol-disulfide oxidoreductase YuxK
MAEEKTTGEKERKNDKIIIFDGVCNLCNRVVQFIIRRDPKARFKFTALQSGYAKELLKDREWVSNQPDIIIYFRGNRIYQKSTAVLLILRDLGGLWAILYLLSIIPRFLRDYFYDKIAINRYRLFGKRESCMIPSPDLKNRFLE